MDGNAIFTSLTPGQRVWTHWHAQVGRHNVTHDSAAIVLRVDGDVITVRETGYGSLPHDVFGVHPADIRTDASCAQCTES